MTKGNHEAVDTVRESRRLIRVWIWGLGTGAAPFFFCFLFVVNLFYLYGAWLCDAGWLASLIWRNNLELVCPVFYDLESFYRHHVSPFFYLLILISHVLPLDMVHFYALFQAGIYTGLTMTMFYLLVTSYRLRTWPGLLAASSLSLAFGANGISLVTLRTLHFESAMSLFLCLVLVFLVRRRLAAAAVILGLGLTIREDLGFQATALLGPIIVLGWRSLKDQGVLKHWIIIGLVAFGYSVSAMTIQYLFFDPIGLFNHLFVGEPPYAHLTYDLIARRLIWVLSDRPYIYLPMLLILAWSIHFRKPVLAAGVLGNLPWLAIHFFAVFDQLGRWSGYAPFPLIAAFFWPLAACVLIYGGTIPARRRKTILIWQSLVLVAALFGPTEMRFDAALSPYPGKTVKAVKSFMNVLSEHKDQLGRPLFGTGIMALSPRGFPTDEFLYSETPVSDRTDSIVYFTTGYTRNHLPKHLDPAGLPRTYQVKDTHIEIITNRELEDLPAFKNLLVLKQPSSAGPGDDVDPDF